MKTALIADIHGNMVALEAVLNDIARQKAEEIICLGDIVGKGPCSKEAIDLCRKECGMILLGNWEKGLYEDFLHCRQGRTDKVSESSLWYLNAIGSERMEYVGALPHCTELRLSGRLIRLFHAHPRNFNRYFEDSPLEQRLELFDAPLDSDEQRTADVAVYADIHCAYMQMIDDKCLMNTGSVGNPLDMTQASYVILDGDESADSPFHVQFVRVPYDIDKAVAAAKEVGVPHLDGYITELTTAQYFKRG